MRLKVALATILTVLTPTAARAAPANPGAVMDQQSKSSEPATQDQPPEPQAPPSVATPYQGLNVESISFPSLPSVEFERLRQMIPQKTGEPLDRDRIRQSIQVLHATGRFADILVEAEPASAGQVSLVFVTQPNYFVGVVSVEGAPNPPAATQLVNASKLQLGEPFTREKLDRAAGNVRQLMEENGYYGSRLAEEELKHPATQEVDISCYIVPGSRAHVGRMTVSGEPGRSEKQIQDIARMHPGDPVSVQLTSRALDRLRKSYNKHGRLLAQVAISGRTYRPETNAVDYDFTATPGPKVEIAVEGFRISRSVLKKNVPVYEENALDDDLLNEGRRNLLNYLQGRGFFDAKVKLRKESVASGSELRVTYTVDAGPRHRLVKVEIEGNKSFSQEQIRSRMQIQPAGRFLSQGRYSQGLLNDDIRNLEENPYRYNGFDQIKITPKVEDNAEGKENQLAITLQIDEGPQTLVGDLQITGNNTKLNDPFPDLYIAAGQPFSQTKIAEDREIILNYYFNHGFPDAAFEAAAKAAPKQPDRMDVAYTIHEGQRVFVNQVITSGLNHTRPYVIQREVQVKSGDALSQIDMLDTQRRLYDLGIFSQVDLAVQNPEGDEQEKNVLLNVQEAKRYTFNYGFGFEFQTGQPGSGTNQPLGETGVSPRVSFGVTRLNFRGRNHTITFKSNVGRLQQRGLLSYDAPRWFNSPNWRLTFTAFYDNTIDVATFTSQRLEGSAQAEEIVSKRADGSASTLMDYRFTYRYVKASHIDISPDQVPLLSQPTRVGIPGFSYIRNKRDNDLESTKGSYTTVDGGVADSHFASETDFGRVLIQNSTYYSFGKKRPGGKRYVFARSTRIGLQTPYGNTIMPQPGQQCSTTGQPVCLPLAERFFSGGGNSHRGFGLNQAGPRDPSTGFPLGGTALFLNNLELRVPPPTLPFFQDNLSFAIFHDAGNVFTNGHDLLHSLAQWQQPNPQLCRHQTTATQCDYNYISHAIGVGVRYKTPVGPVRFDFGYNLNPPAFPQTVTTTTTTSTTTVFVPQRASHFNVFFSIGQTF